MRFRYVVVLAFLLLFANLNAQADCILGVGVTSDSIISDIFQLNEMQHEKLESFSAEIKYRNDILSNELENVKSRHPQSNVTELRQLADKYKVVMDSKCWHCLIRINMNYTCLYVKMLLVQLTL